MNKIAKIVITWLLIIIVTILLVWAISIPSKKYVEELCAAEMYGAAICLTVISNILEAIVLGITGGAIVSIYILINNKNE